MPASTFAPANLQWMGLAKETTRGVAMAAPTFWVPVDSPTWVPTRPPIVDGALRGSMAGEYEQQQGQGHDTIAYKTYFYLDSVYPHLLAVLGNPDTIGGAGPYTHKTALYNGSGGDAAQPPSYTVFYNDGAGKVLAMPGAIPSTVKITIKPEGLAELNVTWVGSSGHGDHPARQHSDDGQADAGLEYHHHPRRNRPLDLLRG
ncbi:hypothetical protein RCH22_000866 [Cryobacterium psychrotolerans]|nr:hypothetical protein [Cryobacterium psychrotolerans]